MGKKSVISVMIYFLVFVVNIEAQTFRILGTPTSPFKISSDQTHSHPGISIDILQHIMKEMGIDYEIQFYPAVARVIQQAKNGNGEMLISYSVMKERFEYLAYPEESYRSIQWNFFIRKEDEGKITFEQLEDLKGLQIGVVRGTSYIKEFWEAETYLQFQIVSKNTQQIPKLLNKRIDIAPLNTRSTLYDLKKTGHMNKVTYLPKPLAVKQYYDPIIKGSSYFDPPPGSNLTREEVIEEFLARYDAIIKKFKEDGTIQNIYNKYGYEFEFK